MPLPLISRAVHEAQVAMLRALLTDSKAEYLRACERYDALLDRHEALLRLAGDALTTKLTPPTPPVRREPDAIDSAIDWAARDDIRRRRHLERYCRALRADGVAPEEIAARVLRGDRGDDDSDGILA